MPNDSFPRAREDSAHYPQTVPAQSLAETGSSLVYPVAAPAQDDDVIDLREYWRILMRRRGIVLAVAGIAVVTALIATFMTTPVYRASVLLQIERESSKVIEFESVVPENTGDTKDFYQTQYELLRSRSLARRVIDQLGLRSSKTFAAGKESSFLKELSGYLASRFSEAQTTDPASDRGIDIETLFLDRLSVLPVKNSRLVRVEFESPDPVEAADIANSLAENFVNASMERRYEAASHAKAFLEERLEVARANLQDSERRLLDYAKEREIVNMDDKLDLLMGRLKEMSTEQVQAESARIAAEAEYRQMAKGGSYGTTGALDSPVIQRLKERLAELEAEYGDKLKVFKPGYPKMQQLKQQIDEISRQIQVESTTVGAAARATYEARLEQEAQLAARTNAIKAEILTLQDRSTDYQTLKRDVDANRQLYDGLLQRMKEIGVVAGIGANNIAVVDPAETPRDKYKPSLPKNLAIALGLGLFVGVGLGFLLEALEDSIKSLEDLEQRIGAPVLGVIPWVAEARRAKDSEQLGLLAFEDPKSALAEAYRSLRTALMFLTSEGAPRLLHVTSPSASEGKTTSACATAITFAQTGSTVLLIDCDLRNPSLHHSFDLPRSQGLADYLIGNATPAEIAHGTQVARLFVVPSGPLLPNPVELLSSDRMVELIRLARERFDYVILDGPPVLGLADAVILANLSRATIVVVESQKTSAAALKGSTKRLRASNANILGAILVKHGRSGSYGYGYGYGYDQNYSYSYGGSGRPNLPAESKS